MPGILFDTNVWVAATFPTHEFHAASLATLNSTTPQSPAIFCRSTEQSFLRLVTSARIISRYGAEGMTNRDALFVLNLLLGRTHVREMTEPADTFALWRQLAALDTASPKVWMDAYLAAFAIGGGLKLATLDIDFKTYESRGLQLVLLVCNDL